MSTPITALFPHTALIAATDETTRTEHLHTASVFRQALGIGGLMTLGASDIHAVPGMHGLGGLALTARILPMRTDGTRSGRPAIMGIMISLTGADTIDVDVRHGDTARIHAQIRDIYIDDLARVALALDYDGDEILNPRYM